MLGLFVQTVFAPWLTFRNAIPSFATIAVVLFALRAGARRGAIVGIVAGVLTDALAGTGGGWTLADATVALACGGVSRGLFADGVVPPAVLVALAVLLRDALFWIVMATEGYPRGFATAHLHASLWQAALTGACALVYLIVRNRVGGARTRVERFA